MGRNHSPSIVTDGLVVCLDPANRKSYSGSGNVVTNLTFSSNNGILANSSTFSTDSLGSFRFNSVNTNDCITISNMNMQRDFTLSCWVKPVTFTSPLFAIFGHGEAFVNDGGLHLTYTGDARVFTYGMWYNDLDFDPGVSVNVWSNFAFTYSHSSPYTKQVYINGKKIAEGTGNQYIGTGNLRYGTQFGIGDYDSGNGYFSQCFMYNRVLTAAEIQQNFNALRGRFGI